jgi:hypothetical protein
VSGQIVRQGKHECQTLSDNYENGTIWRCDCGRYWRLRTYLNPDFNGWRRIFWLGRKLRRLP